MKRPNILVLHTDAQCHNWLGSSGHPTLRTPHLDALAAEGTVFENAYACSAVCGPSRACLMTGRYNIAYGRVNNFGVLPPSEETIGSLFAAGGYRTGYFGKTHYGRDNADMHDEGWEQRFLTDDYNRYLKSCGIPGEYPRNMVAKSRTRYWQMGAATIPAEHYFEPVLGDRAASFIEHNDDRPFLCFLSTIAPHGPFSPPVPYDTLYDPASIQLFPRAETELDHKPAAFVKWVRQNQKYINEQELREFLAISYGLVSLVDDTVGKVVRALKASGQYENTLIVMTSDHGDFGSKYGILGKSWCMDDVLVRIPLFVSHPVHRGTGRRSQALVENVDILPTLLETAGLAIPNKTQGKSLLPIVSGKAEHIKDAVFSFHSSEDSSDRLNLSMVRQGHWKLVQTDTGEDQLYNLETDPHEWTNRINDPACREQRDALRLELLRWHVANTGQFFRSETARFWEAETFFYDETKFNGQRQITRSGEWQSTTS